MIGRPRKVLRIPNAHIIIKKIDNMSQIWDISFVKPARFHPKARNAIQAFPEDVRRELGKAIFDLQKGERLGMPLSRSMPSIGAGVEELRIKDRNGAYRVFYLAKFADAVLIFHAFTKKTQKTQKSEIDLGKKRLKELLDEKK